MSELNHDPDAALATQQMLEGGWGEAHVENTAGVWRDMIEARPRELEIPPAKE